MRLSATVRYEVFGGATSTRGRNDNDVIDVFDDLGGDAVSCGAGQDTVYADAGDDITGECETVVRTAPDGLGRDSRNPWRPA